MYAVNVHMSTNKFVISKIVILHKVLEDCPMLCTLDSLWVVYDPLGMKGLSIQRQPARYVAIMSQKLIYNNCQEYDYEYILRKLP